LRPVSLTEAGLFLSLLAGPLGGETAAGGSDAFSFCKSMALMLAFSETYTGDAVGAVGLREAIAA
jgi:hypothetical protein